MKNKILAALVLCSIQAQAQKSGLQMAVDSLKDEKDPVALATRVRQLSTDQRGLNVLMNYYEGEQKDSIQKITLKRYPLGDYAFGIAQKKLYAENDPYKREQEFKAIVRKFPKQNLDNGRFAVAKAFAEIGKTDKVTAYLRSAKPGFSRLSTAGIIAQEMMNGDPQSAAAILQPEMENLQAQYAYHSLYGDILIKCGRYKEAYPYIKAAYDNFTRHERGLSANYGLLLSKQGRHAEALPILQDLVDEGEAAGIYKAAFAESYEQQHPGKNAQHYLAEVAEKIKTKTEEEVAKMLINEPSPDFELKDEQGRTVTLESFKGKTIIVDFWATWCGPCKKSFPSMQRVVNNYSKDPKVKFLFVHTRETVADPLTDAKNFLRNNKYTFDLYMDMKDPVTKKCPAVTAFKASGIPAKYIIDKDGNIRFKKIGFSGSDDAAVAELSAMIEIAKKG